MLAHKLPVIVLLVALLLSACGQSASPPPAAPPSAKTVTLLCIDCQAAGVKINVWQMAGVSRGNVSFSVPHNTAVSMLDTKTADDGRVWYKVQYQDKVGWIPADFVQP